MGINELVLIAEHNIGDILFYQRALAKAGLPNYRLLQDGSEVITYLKGAGEFGDRSKHPFPGMLILDYTLPRHTGAELLRWMKEHPENRVIPTIIFSSNLQPDIVNECYVLGSQTFFQKPADASELGDLLVEVVHYWKKAQRPAVQQPKLT